MILAHNTIRVCTVAVPRPLLTYPCQLFLSKNGGGYLGPFANRVTNLGGLGTYDGATFTLSATDTDTLGDLAVWFFDGVNSYSPPWTYEVDPYVPGDQLAGDVHGNVDGLVTIDPATRVAIANDVWGTADLIELGLTPQNAMRVIFAVLAGKDFVAPGGAAFQNFGDTKTRCVVTLDAANQRVNVTYDFS